MKVLITDDVDEVMISGLKKLGYLPDYRPEILLEDLGEIVENYVGVVINSKIKMYKDLLDKASQLKFIARLGSGLEIIDLEYAVEKGVQVFSAPEGNRNAVAEHALGMLLSIVNRLNQADRDVRNNIWDREKNRGMELEGKTIGIIGFGHTGSSFAKKLMGFDVEVLAYDKYKVDYTKGMNHVKESSRAEILDRADIISLHLPLTEETFHLVDDDFVKQYNKNGGLINTSRGNIVDTRTLVRSLENKKISYACLDVFENEKSSSFNKYEQNLYERLFALPNVILSPHVAGWSIESKRKISEVLLNKIDKWVVDIDAKR